MSATAGAARRARSIVFALALFVGAGLAGDPSPGEASLRPASGEEAPDPRFETRTQWLMGTALRIQLPRARPDRDALFRACFATVDRWERLLSPWIEDAPLSRLSRSDGNWVELPDELLDYLERALGDAARSGGVFDITLEYRGSESLEIDRERSRARLPHGTQGLDPGGDGKGWALDAVARLLREAGVEEALLDFGGSSIRALGMGPDGAGWRVGLRGPAGEALGELRLRDTALSVSSSVQREELEGGGVEERFHLIDLRQERRVRVRRTVAVLSPSATEAEVLSTSLCILGAPEDDLLERFAPAAVAIFEPAIQPVFLRGFETGFLPARAGNRASPAQHE